MKNESGLKIGKIEKCFGLSPDIIIPYYFSLGGVVLVSICAPLSALGSVWGRVCPMVRSGLRNIHLDTFTVIPAS